MTPRDSYKLQFLFPALGKTPKRKLSDSGCVDGLPASPAKQLAVPIKADSGGAGSGGPEEHYGAQGKADEGKGNKDKEKIDEAGGENEDGLGEPPSPCDEGAK